MVFQEGDMVAVSEIVFDASGRIGNKSAKMALAPYLREQFPDCRLRRRLGGSSDSTFFLQARIDSDVRTSLNEAVLKIDSAPFVLDSKTSLGRVAYAGGGSDDAFLSWMHVAGLTEGAVSMARLSEGGEVLEVIELFGAQPSHLIAIAHSDAHAAFDALGGVHAMASEDQRLLAAYI